MNNYDEKIMIIKENQKKLLEMVKEKLKEESEVVNLNTKNIVDVLNNDSIAVKKYEAILEAQKFIEECTNEIINATSIEEIKEIRKKLNSSINKVKKEMKNRGIDDIEFNNYCEMVKKYRKRISENIRYIKREENISEIERLNNNYDNLNEEELLRLKKLVKNEMSYGKRNLNKDDANVQKNKKSIENEQEKPADKIDLDNKIMIPDYKGNSVVTIETYDSLEDFIMTRVDDLDRQYGINETGEYDSKLIKNIKIFVDNLPKLSKNRNKVRYMVRDYYLFNRKKPEFIAYIEYTKKKNSVLHNIREAVEYSILKDKASYYESEHEKAADWIINFCHKKHMVISYNKTLAA